MDAPRAQRQAPFSPYTGCCAPRRLRSAAEGARRTMGTRFVCTSAMRIGRHSGQAAWVLCSIDGNLFVLHGKQRFIRGFRGRKTFLKMPLKPSSKNVQHISQKFSDKSLGFSWFSPSPLSQSLAQKGSFERGFQALSSESLCVGLSSRSIDGANPQLGFNVCFDHMWCVLRAHVVAHTGASRACAPRRGTSLRWHGSLCAGAAPLS